MHAPPVQGVHLHPPEIAQIHDIPTHASGDRRSDADHQSANRRTEAGCTKKAFSNSTPSLIQKRFYRVSSDIHQDGIRRMEENREKAIEEVNQRYNAIIAEMGILY